MCDNMRLSRGKQEKRMISTIQPRRIWSLIVFGFELNMLKLHMKTIDPYVHEFIVAESTLRFQTNKRKPALLSQNIQEFSPSIQRKTSISVIRKLVNCPRNLKGFSTRCFQS